ncbi:hypothetical protein FACS1894190_00430 [Spirochaetia bacterium]|nr:hypothetical protein FACS1894190_00430 [Spirochaetia bacterium]
MGNNNEIRQRMETYRMVLLALVWIIAIGGMIVGLIMISYEGVRTYGIAVLIMSTLGGIVGHFLVNVGLAIPFILLNNGDYLAAIVPEGKIINNTATSGVPLQEKEDVDYSKYPLIVKNAMKLYETDLSYDSVVSELKIGERLQFIKEGAQVSVAGITAKMFNVKTVDGKIGWCFSGFLQDNKTS